MNTKWQTQNLLRVVSICLMIAGVLTIIPSAGASKASILGYHACCPFSPISTVLAFYVGITIYRYLSNSEKA